MGNALQDSWVQKEGASGLGGVRVGWVVNVTPAGRPQVDFPGSPDGSVCARSVVDTVFDLEQGLLARPRVLLAFENDDLRLPIIIGVLRDSLTNGTSDVDRMPPDVDTQVAVRLPGRPAAAVLDGKTIKLEAKEEILLQCGKASILLRKDGKVVIKGMKLISRSSGSNRIKGASVEIN